MLIQEELKAAFYKFNTVSPKTDHFSRYVSAAVLDMEVDPMIARAIKNWAIHTF